MEVSTNEVLHMLSSIGMPINYIGVQQTAFAVTLVSKDPTYLGLVTKKLYPRVAEHYNVNVSNVERNIRTVIKIMWEKNPEVLEKIAGYQLDRKPTSSHFIALVTECTLRFKQGGWYGQDNS